MRCEKDDVAFIIKAMNNANLNKVVDVVDYIGFFNAGDLFTYNNMECGAIVTDHYWWIVSKGTPFVTGFGEMSKSYTADTWLWPLKGDLSGDDTDTDLGKDLEDVLEKHGEVG